MIDTTPQAADDPFGSQLPPGGLYIGSTLQQRIDLIEHLLEFGRQIIILSGPPGSGKSTLLAALAAAAGKRWNCVTVQGGPALQVRNLYAQVADALDVDLSADSEPRMAQTMLRLRLNVLERAGKLSVLFVDDADQLAPDAVAALVALARNEDQAAEARVLMAANQEHAGLLANVQRERPQHGLVHVVEIPPLAESQTGEFIAQRLGAVGHAVEDYFNPADLQRIAAAAAGNPARVVALARQHHANRPARRETGARRPATRTGKTGALPARRLLPLGDRRLLPLFVLPPLLALAAWWGLRDGDDSAPRGETVAVELPSAPTTTPAAAPPAPSSGPEPAPPPVPDATPPRASETPPDPRLAESREPELIEIVLPDEPVPPPADGVPAPSPAPTVPPAAAAVTPATDLAASSAAPTPAPSVTAPALAPRPTPAPGAPGPTQQTRSAVAPKPALPARPAPPPARPAPTRVTGFSADWLLKQPRGAYTLQLAGVRDRASAVRFIQHHGLGAAATILVTRRDGQPWYVLVHGYYPTRQAALAAAARLPAGVRKEVKPWARSVGELAELPH